MTERPAPPTRSQVLERTRAWVRETFLYMRPDWPLGDDESLLQRGVIDSIGVIELTEFLRATFDIAIAEEEITATNLGTLSAIAAFVAAKLAARAEGGAPSGAKHVA